MRREPPHCDLTCAICQRLVEGITIETGVYDITLGGIGTRVTAYCHGEQARMLLPHKDSHGIRVEVPTYGIAFAPGIVDFFNGGDNGEAF